MFDKSRNLVLPDSFCHSKSGIHAGLLGDFAAPAAADRRADKIRTGESRTQLFEQGLTHVARQILTFKQPCPNFRVIAKSFSDPADRNARH